MDDRYPRSVNDISKNDLAQLDNELAQDVIFLAQFRDLRICHVAASARFGARPASRTHRQFDVLVRSNQKLRDIVPARYCDLYGCTIRC